MCEFNPSNSGRRIDPCMKNIIYWLQINGIKTLACCCGHGKYPPSIVVNISYPFEIFSYKNIPRKTRFYKKDEDGYYYIPEAI